MEAVTISLDFEARIIASVRDAQQDNLGNCACSPGLPARSSCRTPRKQQSATLLTPIRVGPICRGGIETLICQERM